MDKASTGSNHPPLTAEPLKLPTQPEATLQDILDTMHESEFFPHTGKDTPSQFWSAYERMAKQHDNEFLERENSDMDVLLIFAGLFSAVSSAFIVSMASSLTPNPSDTTNALLKILINKVDNGTFSDQDASLPVWTGPGSTVVWIQALAYAGLSTSLMAAFGAVLCKQWLGYFKTSRFGKGSLDQRCKRRQQKLVGLESWRLKTIIAMLPIFLQLSLLFFGVALSANIWTQQRTVASVIIGTTSLGVVFYMFTVIASLQSPDCPFRTPVSAILKRGLPHVVTVPQRICQGASDMFQPLRQDVPLMTRQASWENFLNRLNYALISLKRILSSAFRSGWDLTTRSMLRFLAYTSRVTWQASLCLDDPESAITTTTSTRSILFYPEGLDVAVKPIEASSVQWILETSTDTEMIFAAVRMIPEVEWPDQLDITGMLDRVKSRLFLCFGSTRQLLPLTQGHAIACLKAIYHLCLERGQDNSLQIIDDTIWSYDHGCLYQIPKFPGFQMVSCVQGLSVKLDITSLTPSDRMWMAHMFTYRLHKGDHDPEFEFTVIYFINSCLIDPTSPGRLVADCLILAGVLIGLSVNRRQLARMDKSTAIPHLRDWVITRLLDILLNEPSIQQEVAQEHHILNARKLLLSFRYLGRDVEDGNNNDIAIRCLKLSFRLLDNEGEVSRDGMVTTLLSLSNFYYRYHFWRFLCQRGPRPQWVYWLGPPSWHTPAQFELLVDYLMRLCQGTDYVAIEYAFWVLGALRHSPRPLDVYIARTIHFMGPDMPFRTRIAAMNAACIIQTEVALLGRDDASFRYRFSNALMSTVRGDTQVDNPFKDPSFTIRPRVPIYLRLLCTLAEEPTWHGQLQRSGHIDNCLAIADTLRRDARLMLYNDGPESVVCITHIFAIVDALGEEHQFHKTIQTYPSRQLILNALRHIFLFPFFEQATEDNLKYIASTGYLEMLPALVGYAKRSWERWDNTEDGLTLIQLVGEVCDKLDEERHRGEEGSLPSGLHGTVSFGHQGIPEVSDKVVKLLNTISW